MAQTIESSVEKRARMFTGCVFLAGIIAGALVMNLIFDKIVGDKLQSLATEKKTLTIHIDTADGHRVGSFDSPYDGEQ